MQKAVQIILRRTLFRERLAAGTLQDVEYAGARVVGGGRVAYEGNVTLPLLGRVTI